MRKIIFYAFAILTGSISAVSINSLYSEGNISLERYGRAGLAITSIRSSFGRFREELSDFSNSNNLSPDTLTSTEILAYDKASSTTKQEIAQCKTNIKNAIFNLVKEIENHNALSLPIDVHTKYSPGDIKYVNQVNYLLSSDRLSLESISVSIELLHRISNQVKREAENTEMPELKYQKYVYCGSLVYEITDIIISILEDIKLSGSGELIEIRDKEALEIKRIEKRIEVLKISSNNPEELTNFNNYIEASHVGLLALDSLIANVTETEKRVRGDLPTLIQQYKRKRQEADIFLSILYHNRITREILSNFVALTNYPEYQEFELPLLNEETALKLLGPADVLIRQYGIERDRSAH